MTGAQIITKLENMTQDVLDEDFAVQLMNDAKDEVEAMSVWEQLKKSTSYSVSAGYVYTSVLGALPTRFALDRHMIEDNSVVEYSKVEQDDLTEQQFNPLGYFIDLSAGNIHLSGTNHGSKTMKFYYSEFSPTLTTANSWSFPERFHSILVLKMAELYYLSDAGEKSRSWSPEWAAQFERKLRQMELWNDSLKLRNRRPTRTLRQTPLNVV